MGGQFMGDATPFAALWADFDLSGIRDFIFLVLRLFLAVAAAFLAWLLAGPLLRALYRVVVRRPAPGFPVSVGRLASAVAVGVLVFWYLPIGGGGGGLGLFGGGSGSGSGAGPGGPHEGTGKGKDETAKDAGIPGTEVLRIEMVVSKRVPRGDDRYYLKDGQEPPRNLESIKKLLEENNKRWGQMEIIIYANGPAEESGAVQDLKELARQHGLTPVVPEQYLNKEKAVNR
jgi:hypothetical protein